MSPGDPRTSDPRASRPEERDRLLAEVVAHAEVRDARYRVPSTDRIARGRWKGVLSLVFFVTAAILAVAPPGWLSGPPVPVIQPADHEFALRAMMHLQAEGIDLFRAREGRLPDSLDEVGGALPGVRYIRSDNRLFQLLGFLPDGSDLTYDSARPTDDFAVLDPFWKRVGAP